MKINELLERIERAIRTASKEAYSDRVSVPLAMAVQDVREVMLRVDRIDQALRVPAAEYVPAISDVFHIIDGSAAQ